MKYALLAIGLMTAAPFAAAPAFAQGAPQTLVNLNVSTVSTGYRASKVIGATIVNDMNEKVGTVDDLIINRSDRVPYAIVSVGGFLGMGDKLVAVPMGNLQFATDKTIFAGATKDMLKTLPAFTYAK
jgi:sporulation protein YlmC with PRC-barrel domain